MRRRAIHSSRHDPERSTLHYPCSFDPIRPGSLYSPVSCAPSRRDDHWSDQPVGSLDAGVLLRLPQVSISFAGRVLGGGTGDAGSPAAQGLAVAPRLGEPPGAPRFITTTERLKENERA